MKPEAFLFVEKNGAYAKHCKTKTQALKAIVEELKSWGEDYLKDRVSVDPDKLTENDVKETWYRQCRACDVETIGDDDTCYECCEPRGTKGRKCFAVWF